MSEPNRQLVRRFFDDMCNGRRLDLADQLFTRSHVYHDPASPWVSTGPDGMKGLIGAYHGAFRDARWHVHEMMDAQHAVITRWSGRGTHSGDLMGVAPTGKPVSVDGIWIHRVSNGTIAESWNVWDMLGLLQQIGVVPRLGGTR
jgi:steroid delta-isomerase-like uncharacterized protein